MLPFVPLSENAPPLSELNVWLSEAVPAAPIQTLLMVTLPVDGVGQVTFRTTTNASPVMSEKEAVAAGVAAAASARVAPMP